VTLRDSWAKVSG